MPGIDSVILSHRGLAGTMGLARDGFFRIGTFSSNYPSDLLVIFSVSIIRGTDYILQKCSHALVRRLHYVLHAVGLIGWWLEHVGGSVSQK